MTVPRKLLSLTLLMLAAAPVRADDDLLRMDDNAALQYWPAFSMFTEEMKRTMDDVEPAGGAATLAPGWLGDDNRRLAYLHAGAAMPRCDWGLDFSKGIDLLLPHLNDARYLAKLALLRARHRFESGRGREAIEDVEAALELARDVGDSPVLVSLFVRYGIENMAIDTLARYLPSLDRSTLDHLANGLETLPAEDSMRRAWPAQSRYVVDWASAEAARVEQQSGGDPAKWAQGLLELRKYFGGDNPSLRAIADDVPTPERFRASLQGVRELLVELGEATDLPAAEQDARVAEVQRSVAADPVAMLLVHDPRKAFQVRRRWQTRHALLDAAVAVAREGEGALNEKRFADPFGDGAPFDYRKTEGGFELRSKLTFNGEPVALMVGKTAIP